MFVTVMWIFRQTEEDLLVLGVYCGDDYSVNCSPLLDHMITIGKLIFWPLGDKKVKIDVVIVDKTTVKFRIKDEAVWNRVLRRGMWNICGIPMIISKWSPIEEDAQPEVKKMSVWVVVKNVPRYMYAWEGFAFMTSPIGEPIRLHPETDMCKNFVGWARVFDEDVLTKDFYLLHYTLFTAVEQGNIVSPVQVNSGSKEKEETIDPKKVVDVDQEEGWSTPPHSMNSPRKGGQSTRIGSRDSRGGFNGGKLNPKDNTNGVQNKVTSQVVVLLIFGCLIETKIKEKKEEMIVSRVFHGWSSMSNYEHHRLGRLWVVWKQNVRVTPLFKSSQVISCSIFVEGRTEEMLITFVYALNTPEERKALWEDLKTHKDSGMFRGKPWLICGDFNEIIDMEKHSLHDSTATIPEGMSDFQDLVNYCELVDLSYQGPKYTWCNKRKDDLICKKLDRVLANQEWLNHYTQSYCVFESGGCSDHNRCRLYMKEEAVRVKRPFKFSNVLVSHAGYMNNIKEKWATMEPLYHSTSALFRFSKKSKHLKPSLRSMGRELLSDLERKTKETYIKLCTIQEVTMSNPSSQVVEEEALAYNIWSRLADIEERYFKQKAKLRWVNHGDQNTKAFHTAVKLREVRNNIREIICFDGSVCPIVEVILNREADVPLTDFMHERPLFCVEWSVSELKEVLDFQCTEEDKQLLAKEVNEEEIRKVVFAMPREKSPGPDGFLPKGINSTILALIPKKKGAKTMKDYRPISCCNVVYKIISKILANRLKVLLPKFITPNQSAFVKDRLLMENLLLATEIINDYHKEDITARCAMKIDISKAFDSVQWPFLLNVLKALDMPDKYIHWINLCISSASFSVQIDEPARIKRIGLHPGCHDMNLTHLCFADDLMVFVEGDKRSIEGALAVIIDDYTIQSGFRNRSCEKLHPSIWLGSEMM
ncbi:non-LTR retroelement reverse transcriptase-like protein [Tanacetum coccineum]